MTRQSPSALWALRDDRSLSEHAKMAYVMLWTRLPDARPSMATLAGDMSASLNTAKRAVRELECAGLLKRLPRVTADGDSDTNRYELLPVMGGSPEAPPPGLTGLTGTAPQAPKDSNPKKASEGRNTLGSRRARPAVTRAEDQIEIVRQAAAEACWDTREIEDEDALDVWARFVADRKTEVPLAAPVKYLAGIFASFVSWDGVLSNTPERG